MSGFVCRQLLLALVGVLAVLWLPSTIRAGVIYTPRGLN
jgi:hypothetical protein